MESIMDEIETRLKQGATPKSLIIEGFKKSTVYKVDKRLRARGGLGNADETRYLALLMCQIYQDLCCQILDLKGDSTTDPFNEWNHLVANTDKQYKNLNGKEPPKELGHFA